MIAYIFCSYLTLTYEHWEVYVQRSWSLKSCFHPISWGQVNLWNVFCKKNGNPSIGWIHYCFVWNNGKKNGVMSCLLLTTDRDEWVCQQSHVQFSSTCNETERTGGVRDGRRSHLKRTIILINRLSFTHHLCCPGCWPFCLCLPCWRYAGQIQAPRSNTTRAASTAPTGATASPMCSAPRTTWGTSTSLGQLAILPMALLAFAVLRGNPHVR